MLCPPEVPTDLRRDRDALKGSCVTATCCESQSLKFCALRPPEVSTDLVFEEPVDFDKMSARVPATSTKHSTRDASEKLKDHTVPEPSSADFSAG